MPEYADTLPIGAARARYFEANGFGADGGYGARWVTGRFGPIPFAFPNLEARVRAVRLHDLHHVITGYDTDGIGEGEISAWEIASGCGHYWAAWLLNLGGMTAGSLLAGRRVFRAFVRGRGSRNLYHEGADPALLDTPVGELRRRLLLREDEPVRVGDRLAFAAWLALGVAAIAVQLALLLLPVVAIVAWLR